MSSEPTTPKKDISRQIFKDYLTYAWKYKALFIGVVVTVIFSVLIHRYVPPLIIAGVLERLSNGDFTNDIWQSFGTSILLYIAAAVVGSIILWRLAVVLIWTLEVRVVKDIHRTIFDHLMKLDANFHANKFGGSLVSQANKYASAYVRIVDTTVFEVSALVLSFIFTTIILWPRVPQLVIFLWIFSAIFIFFAIKITGHIRRLSAVQAAASNRQTGFLADMITNVMAVKSYTASSYENERYAVVTSKAASTDMDLMRASVKRDVIFSTSTTLLAIGAFVIAIASVVLWGADIATVYLVVQYTGIIGQELWSFTRSTLRNYNRALGDAEEMTSILNTQPTVPDPQTPEKLRVKQGSITFEHVVFNHDGADAPIFNDFTLAIKAGERIGLVGHSGSGKTTFTRLLLRFSDVDSGKITLDTQNISHISQDDLRSTIAYVPQEPLLFHRSLRENIAYGNPQATERQIIAAAKKAHVLEFVKGLPQGFDTLVGERGVKLSGGQRQRIAIARAILKDAPILLLDEATSALDSESEKLIQDALEKLMKGRTSIVIAHRLSTIAKLDRIIVLERGKIIEDGSHVELLKKKGTYASLWSHQSGGFIEE